MRGWSEQDVFVGRTSELDVFERALERARAGTPAVVLVGGDAGIGKSTLIAEAARRTGVRLLTGRCVPRGGDLIPLAPLTELVRGVRRDEPELLELDALGPLAAWIGPAHGELAAGTLFEPVLTLVGELTREAPVMVAVEDLHWADPVTWDLVDFLARNLVDEQVVLVGSYRADEIAASPTLRRRIAELTRLPVVHRVHLGGLGRDDVAARVAALVGAPAPVELVDDVYARGEGNPFFTEELVAAHLHGGGVPAVLADLIAADLDGLDDTARRTLDALAVLGRLATHDELTSVTAEPDATVEAAVRRLAERRLVTVEGDGYRLRHALIGDVVYADLLPPTRSRLHRRVADVLGDDVGDRADRAGELAFHLDRAGDHAAAFTALLAAADATETVAPAAALRHLERAFELWDAAGAATAGVDRAARLWQAAELAGGSSSNDRAIELARLAADHGPPPRGAAWGHERVGRYLWAAGRLEESAVEYARAAELLRADADVAPHAATTFAGLGQAALMLGDYDEAAQHATRTFELVATVADDPFAWSMGRRVLGVVASHHGRADEGLALCEDAVAAAPSAHTRALATVYLGTVAIDAGRYLAVAGRLLDAAVDAHLAGIDRSFGAYIDALAAEALVRGGRWADADTLLARQPIPGTLPIGLIRVARVDALLAARRGDDRRAQAALAEAERHPIDPWHRAFLDHVAGEVHVLAGRWDAAAEVAERALATPMGALPVWQHRFTFLATIADVERALDALARRDPAAVDRVVEAARARLDRLADTDGTTEQAALRAHATATITRLTDADADAWAHAAHAWEALGDPFWRAQALLHEADASASSGAAARAADALREAHRVATELGAAGLLGEVDALARRARLSVDAPEPVDLDGAAAERLGLTSREAEVLALVAAGLTNRQIGEALYVSEKTASVHVSNILRKLGVTSRVDAAAIAQRVGVG